MEFTSDDSTNSMAMANGKAPVHQVEEEEEDGGGGSFMKLARNYMSELICGTRRGRGLVAQRVRALAYEKGPRAQLAARQSIGEVLDWIRESGPLKSAFFLLVGVGGVGALGTVAAFLVVFVSATANAILISFILSVSLLGFLMVSFFTSLTAVYVGALLAAGVTISAVTFFSICGMIMAAGWFTFSWGVWNVLQRILLAMKNAALSLKPSPPCLQQKLAKCL